MDYRKGQPADDLGGAWRYAYIVGAPEGEYRTTADLEAAGLAFHEAQVPGCFELDLHRCGLIPDPFFGMNPAGLRWTERAHVWYIRRFRAEPPPDREAVLTFEGLDCFADIYLNGEHLGATDNMLVAHAFPVTGRLRAENELLVHIRPAVEEARQHDYSPSLNALPSGWEALHVRKAPHMYGWDIMPRFVSAGLWRPVTLRYLPMERLEWAWLETQRIAPDQHSAALRLHYRARTVGGPGEYAIRVEGRCGESAFQAQGPMLFDAGALYAPVDAPALWWPRGRGEAALYDVRVSLLKDGTEVDHLALTHGIRTVELERTDTTDSAGQGAFCFRVNGERLFAKGTNWVPADAFHARDRERLPHMVEMAADLGCNMIRCWGGNVYEDDLFYDLCDREGILIWQDFSMACAVYPQDEPFRRTLETEARQVVRRLRQHACVALWAGDNECDMAYAWGGRRRDPNMNALTREVLPHVLAAEDPSRPYLPSSPYIAPEAFQAGDPFLPEYHLWGPRDYFKSDFYTGSLCHFASEIGYHGCPSPDSMRRFLSPERLWPYRDNPEWLLHATSPIPGVDLFDYRVELMAKQVREMFGAIPDGLEPFAFASQAVQAEAFKFFIELFRSMKWRRTGILWWNLVDGWPQLSDAVVDYYFEKKLAYDFIKRAQVPLLLMLREPRDWGQNIVASNDTREDAALAWSVRDVETGETIAEGEGVAAADAVTMLGRIPFFASQKRFYVLSWRAASGEGSSHYLSGHPPFDVDRYRAWLRQAGFLKTD